MLFVLAVLPCMASAQTQNVSIAVSGGGTLTYQYQVQTGSCGTVSQTSANMWQSFSYTPSGGSATPLGGNLSYVYPCSAFQVNGGWDYVNNNYSSNDWSNQVTLSPAVLANNQYCTITFSASEGSAVGSASASCQPETTAAYYPKYQVLSVVYSPPGNESSNGFTDTTSTGTNTKIGSTFTEGSTITFTEGFGNCTVGCSSLSQSFGVSASSLNNTAFQETFSDAISLTNKTQSTQSNNINHTHDLIATWLNPEIKITGDGSTPVSYSVGVAPTADGQTPDPDIIALSANVMMAQPGTITTTNKYGQSAIPAAWLNQQEDPATGQNTPGMASLCANLNVSEYDNLSCTTADQCGCNPNDFALIIAQDPLVNYSGTESPLTANVSTSTASSAGCDTIPTPAGSSCRYIPVPEAPDSTTQETITVAGPDSSGGNNTCNGFTQQENQASTQTLGGTDAYSVGASEKVGGFGFSVTHANTLTWTQLESEGTSTGTGVSAGVDLCSATVGCGEQAAVYEDTVYHTFVFQAGNASCP